MPNTGKPGKAYVCLPLGEESRRVGIVLLLTPGIVSRGEDAEKVHSDDRRKIHETHK